MHMSLSKTHGHQYFLVDELPKQINTTDVHFQIDFYQPLCGSIFKNTAESPFCNLDIALEIARSTASAFCTIGSTSFA